MGYFSQLHASILEAGYDPDMLCEPQSEAEFELQNAENKVLQQGSRHKMSQFVESCRNFHSRNGFLTDKQIEALRKIRT